MLVGFWTREKIKTRVEILLTLNLFNDKVSDVESGKLQFIYKLFTSLILTRLNS